MAKTLVYEQYPPAWEGIKQMTEFLPNVARLGTDFVWLAPVYLTTAMTSQITAMWMAGWEQWRSLTILSLELTNWG